MAKQGRKGKRQRKAPRRAYLVRPWFWTGMPAGEASGYYFSHEEAEKVKQELDANYPGELHVIEVCGGDPKGPAYGRCL